jgi:aminoglycoside phosphotransferase (APT) family kinase protein
VPTLDLDPPILDWLIRHALPGHRITGTEPLTGGYVNDNLLIVSHTGDRYVLRRYRRRNTCAIEAALAARLVGVVPVPEVVAADPDGTHAGEPVLLSRFVPGTLLSETLSDSTSANPADLGRATGETLAAIGTVEFPYPGFFEDSSLEPVRFEPTERLATFVVDRIETAELSDADKKRLIELAKGYEPLLATVASARQLVHADFNPKNILVRDSSVAAVLDWEFAFSSTPLFDVGNMLRFAERYPHGYLEGFRAGFVAGGGVLPAGWERISAGLDMFSLVDFLTRPPDHPYFQRARKRLLEGTRHA